MKSVTIARVVALLWAGFWTFFFVAEARAWNSPGRVVALWLGIGLVFIILALVGWSWERGGGILLAAAGLLIGTAYVIWGPRRLPLTGRVITTVTLGGPPLVAGILFLLRHREVAARTAP